MDGDWIVWGVALAVVIDVAMLAWASRYAARVLERGRQAAAEHFVCGLSADDDRDAFESASNERYSHYLLTNPATGLPMLDGVWVDVAGNPYGADLTNYFESNFYGSGADDFGSGLGGMHDG